MANDAYIDTSEDNGNPFEGFYELSEYEQWLEKDVCQYCYQPQVDKRVCCGEVHFIKAKELENECA